MKRKIITTSDGSKTIHIEDWNEHYHSKHGAINEAKHVFIKHGLKYVVDTYGMPNSKISILEIGFGTGLNAFLTALFASKTQIIIQYVGVEAYPVKQNELDVLNYPALISESNTNIFKKIHATNWDTFEVINAYFKLKKHQEFFENITTINQYNIVYYDAFGARVQPQLWTEIMFRKMYIALKPKGVLVTYSAKGSVRRALQAVGFKVERLIGPPGKREMLRAIKSD